MPVYYEHVHVVSEDEIDLLGHANNIVYLKWMQDAAVAHSSAQGWSGESYAQRGWAWLVRQHTIEYRRPALVNEQILIRTWVADMERFSSRRKFEMFRNDKLIARAETKWAFVDTAQGKLIPVPKEVADAFEVVTG